MRVTGIIQRRLSTVRLAVLNEATKGNNNNPISPN